MPFDDMGEREEETSGYVMISPPDVPIFNKLKSYFEDVHSLKIWSVDSIEKMNELFQEKQYGGIYDDIGDNKKLRKQACFAISFNSWKDNKWDYNIQFNLTLGDGIESIYPFDSSPIVPFTHEETKWLKMHTERGYPYIQNTVDTFILQQATNKDAARIEVKGIRMPVKGYKKSNIYDKLSSFIGILTMLPILLTYLKFVSSILKEKETRISENLKNMGLRVFNNYLAWIFFYITVVFICSVIWTICIMLLIFPNGNPLFLWLAYFLCGVFMITAGFFISAFFTTPKSGVYGAIILFVIFYAFAIAMGNAKDAEESTVTIFTLSPVAGLERVLKIFLIAEGNDTGVSISNFSSLYDQYRFSTFVIISIVESIIFFFLGMYFDQVLPTEYGVKQHPLFCIGLRNRSEKRNDDKFDIDQDSSRNIDYEEEDEMKKTELDKGTCLEIKNLSKVYGNNKKAVDNLSITMFNNQIFALLGHNGAGKSTTISMISGLLKLSSGSIKVKGLDIVRDEAKIKKIMGVCPQVNPLYDNLTCAEHLYLYSAMKGCTETERNIDELLMDVDLFDKKNFPAGRLSGGQKRKLCVAMAFVGGSEVVLLDEPTSGMDAYARRRLWETIQKYKNNRIIILTTHYMDEADYLGDRIGIMGKGTLLTLGQSLFLKKRFGVGYTLTAVKQDASCPTDKVTKMIKSICPTAIFEDDISKEIKYLIPESEAPRFESLFKKLEDEKVMLGLNCFGISLTTLEDVFLKVAAGHDIHKKEKDSKEIDPWRDEPELDQIRIKGGCSLFMLQFGALLKKRYIYSKRDIRGLFCEIFIPIIIIVLGFSYSTVSFLQDPAVGYLSTSYIKKSDISVILNSGSAFDKFATILGEPSAISLKREEITTIEEYNEKLKSEFDQNRLWSYFIDSANIVEQNYKYSIFFNTSAPHGVNVAINEMNTAILRTATGDDNAVIKVKFDPFPMTSYIKQFNKSASAIFTIMFLAIAISFIPSNMIMFIVYEREAQIKHQQLVSGIGVGAYWIANLLVDFIKVSIVLVVAYIMYILANIEAIMGESDKNLMLIVILFGYALCIVTFTYLTSFLFKNSTVAQTVTFVYNFVGGLIIMIILLQLRVNKGTGQDVSVYILEFIMRLLPNFSCTFGLLKIAYRITWVEAFELETEPKAWDNFHGAGVESYYLYTGIIFYLSLIFLIECKNGKLEVDNKSNTYTKNSERLSIIGGNDDVAAEELYTRTNSDRLAITVTDLKKTYDIAAGGCCGIGGSKVTKKAVRGITFGIEKGDCFGLLGTNGAGKTTTFKMLSGDITPSEGKATIMGLDASADRKKARYLIGYCPQFDALLDLMTSREHLELYAAIKGIPKKYWNRMIDTLLDELNLRPFEHVNAGTYSGGNKRKLSVAMAIIGSPPIVFLDEPSSGMDPEARRFMWGVISKISGQSKRSTVILTTHSMEEAEALSSKLSIMVEGKIKCIGPVQGLKNKYAKGFELEAKIYSPTIDESASIISKIGLDNPHALLNRAAVESALRKGGFDKFILLISDDNLGAAIHQEVRIILISS